MNQHQICKFCGKCFKRKTYYDKHVLLCERIDQNKKIKPTNESLDLIESKDYKSILMNLLKQQEIFKKQIHELMQYNYNVRRKVNVLEWMNTNLKCDQNISDFLDELHIQKSELNYIFQNNLQEGILYILKNNIDSDSPCKCFDVKKEIYIYENKWILLTEEDFTEIINKIHKKILNKFSTWKEENSENMKNEDFSLIFANNCSKVVSPTLQTNLNKLMIKIYNNHKECFRTILNFDFV